jgi:hypothetical protein
MSHKQAKLVRATFKAADFYKAATSVVTYVKKSIKQHIATNGTQYTTSTWSVDPECHRGLYLAARKVQREGWDD